MALYSILTDVLINAIFTLGGVLFGFHLGVLKERYRQRIKLANNLKELVDDLQNTPLEGINDLVKKQIVIEYANRTMDFLRADMAWEEAIKSKKKLPRESLEENTP